MVSLSPEVVSLARTMMVDSQLRPNKVTDSKLIEIFGTLPREAFLPAELGARAYTDENVRLANGRALLAPMVLARLVQEAAISAGQKVLIVGAGTGYTAAIVAELGAKVTALESDATLASIARPALAQYARSVSLVAGKLSDGYAANAPYDCILVEGAADFVPDALVAQLAADGRIVLVRHDRGRVGAASVGVRSGSAISFAPKFDCTAPLLPSLSREPAFVF